MPTTAGTGTAGASRSRVRRRCGSAAPPACWCARRARWWVRWRPTGPRAWCQVRSGPTGAGTADRSQLPAREAAHPLVIAPLLLQTMPWVGACGKAPPTGENPLTRPVAAGPAMEGELMNKVAGVRDTDRYVLDLTGLRHADLPLVGGKAAGLGELTQVDGAHV